MSRLTDAMAIRDAVFPLVRNQGSPIKGTPPIPMLTLPIDPVSVLLVGPYRDPPFAPMPLPVADGTGPLCHMLEIRHGGQKVFSVDWADDGTFGLSRFVRGEWETTIRDLSETA